jgi:signal transduction histidine kinase
MAMGDFSNVLGSSFIGDGSTFVIAAHELKAPISLIRQLVFELENNTALSDEQLTLLHQISVVSEKSLRLTSNITKSARLDESLFESEPINAQQLCEDVAHELWPLYKAHQREIRVNKRRKPPLVIANRELLYRILLSFGDNSLHYASHQPAEFTVTNKQERVLVGLRDSGPIIPRTGTKTDSPFISGRPHASGLGLAIAERFAGVMGGTIGSTKHRDGMTFYVSINPSVQLSLL